MMTLPNRYCRYSSRQKNLYRPNRYSYVVTSFDSNAKHSNKTEQNTKLFDDNKVIHSFLNVYDINKVKKRPKYRINMKIYDLLLSYLIKFRTKICTFMQNVSRKYHNFTLIMHVHFSYYFHQTPTAQK